MYLVLLLSFSVAFISLLIVIIVVFNRIYFTVGLNWRPLSPPGDCVVLFDSSEQLC